MRSSRLMGGINRWGLPWLVNCWNNRNLEMLTRESKAALNLSNVLLNVFPNTRILSRYIASLNAIPTYVVSSNYVSSDVDSGFVNSGNKLKWFVCRSRSVEGCT